MIRLIFTIVLASAMSACSTNRVSAEDVQLMPASAARAILEKWYGKDWVNSPEVRGSGFSDSCNNSRRRVAYQEFVSGTYNKIGVQPAVLSVIIADGRWTTCAYVKEIQVTTLEEAKQVIAAINSLGGRIEKFYSN